MIPNWMRYVVPAILFILMVAMLFTGTTYQKVVFTAVFFGYTYFFWGDKIFKGRDD